MDRARIHEGIRRMRFTDILGRSERAELSQMEAAELLGISERTFRRWRDRHRDSGPAGLDDRRLARLIHTHSRDSETTIVQRIESPHRSGVTTAPSTRSPRVSQWPHPLVPKTRRHSAFPLLSARRWWRRLMADGSPPTVASCCSAPWSGNSVSPMRLRR